MSPRRCRTHTNVVFRAGHISWKKERPLPKKPQQSFPEWQLLLQTHGKCGCTTTKRAAATQDAANKEPQCPATAAPRAGGFTSWRNKNFWKKKMPRSRSTRPAIYLYIHKTWLLSPGLLFKELNKEKKNEFSFCFVFVGGLGLCRARNDFVGSLDSPENNKTTASSSTGQLYTTRGLTRGSRVCGKKEEVTRHKRPLL